MTGTNTGFLRPRRMMLWAAGIILGALAVAPHAHAARTINSVLLTFSTQVNVTSVTVPASATIAAAVNVTTSGSGVASRWRATSWRIGSGTFTCVDHSNNDGVGTFTVTFNITAPAVADTYNAEFIAHQDNGCTGGTNGSTTFTLTNGVIVDTTAPTVSSINRVSATPTNAAIVQWTVTISESVPGVGVGTADFALVQGGGVSGASITSVTGSGTTYTVTANTGTGDGTLGLNLVDDDSIVDLAGNRLGGTGTGNGNFTGQVYTITRVTVSSFDAVEVGAAKATNIRTKLSGVNFSLDVLALNSAGNFHAGYVGTAQVEIVNASTGGGVCSDMTQLQNLGNFTFTTGEAGRKTVAFNYANAAANARIRITDSTVSVTSCSTDNFAIRPTVFSAPTSTFNNSGTSGTPVTTTGGNFDITAVAIADYNGTPSIDNTQITAHAGAVQTGSVSGSFGAANPATGTATGSTFTYSEVGNFTIGVNGVFDSTFTSVDTPGTDCTNDFSNTLSGVLYGCQFGNSSATAAIGRFRPDHFLVTLGTLTNRRLLSCAPASTFTYGGEELRVTFLLTARNGLATPATTQNYTTASGFAKLDGTSFSSFSFAGVDLADATPPLSATAFPTTRFAGTSSAATWLAGTASFTVDLSMNRAASSDGPFELFRLGILPADADAVTPRAVDLNLDTDLSAVNDRVLVGSSKMRFGRLRLQNAHGSELLNLPIPMTVQYWNGTVFVPNTLDSCTTIIASDIRFNYLAATPNLVACETAMNLGGTIAFSAGVAATTRLTRPGAGNNGAVDLTVNLNGASGNTCTAVGAANPATNAGRPYLQGAWTGTAYDDDPTARATFGVYKGRDEFIYLRESY